MNDVDLLVSRLLRTTSKHYGKLTPEEEAASTRGYADRFSTGTTGGESVSKDHVLVKLPLPYAPHLVQKHSGTPVSHDLSWWCNLITALDFIQILSLVTLLSTRTATFPVRVVETLSWTALANVDGFGFQYLNGYSGNRRIVATSIDAESQMWIFGVLVTLLITLPLAVITHRRLRSPWLGRNDDARVFAGRVVLWAAYAGYVLAVPAALFLLRSWICIDGARIDQPLQTCADGLSADIVVVTILAALFFISWIVSVWTLTSVTLSHSSTTHHELMLLLTEFSYENGYSNDFMASFWFLHSPFTRRGAFYLTWTMCVKMLLGIVHTTLTSFPTVQAGVMLFVVCAHIVYIVLARPFRLSVYSFLNAFCFLFLAAYLLLVFLRTWMTSALLSSPHLDTQAYVYAYIPVAAIAIFLVLYTARWCLWSRALRQQRRQLTVHSKRKMHVIRSPRGNMLDRALFAMGLKGSADGSSWWPRLDAMLPLSTPRYRDVSLKDHRMMKKADVDADGGYDVTAHGTNRGEGRAKRKERLRSSITQAHEEVEMNVLGSQNRHQGVTPMHSNSDVGRNDRENHNGNGDSARDGSDSGTLRALVATDAGDTIDETRVDLGDNEEDLLLSDEAKASLVELMFLSPLSLPNPLPLHVILNQINTASVVMQACTHSTPSLAPVHLLCASAVTLAAMAKILEQTEEAVFDTNEDLLSGRGYGKRACEGNTWDEGDGEHSHRVGDLSQLYVGGSFDHERRVAVKQHHALYSHKYASAHRLSQTNAHAGDDDDYDVEENLRARSRYDHEQGSECRVLHEHVRSVLDEVIVVYQQIAPFSIFHTHASATRSMTHPLNPLFQYTEALRMDAALDTVFGGLHDNVTAARGSDAHGHSRDDSRGSLGDSGGLSLLHPFPHHLSAFVCYERLRRLMPALVDAADGHDLALAVTSPCMKRYFYKMSAVVAFVRILEKVRQRHGNRCHRGNNASERASSARVAKAPSTGDDGASVADGRDHQWHRHMTHYMNESQLKESGRAELTHGFVSSRRQEDALSSSHQLQADSRTNESMNESMNDAAVNDTLLDASIISDVNERMASDEVAARGAEHGRGLLTLDESAL